jgi:hypothetical protein
MELNRRFKKITKLPHIIRVIKSRMIRWAGGVGGMRKIRIHV